jgi:hypothetical protein
VLHGRVSLALGELVAAADITPSVGVAESGPRCDILGFARAEPVGGEISMGDPVEALVPDLLDWIGQQPRPYTEVMDAWRTSCPRLPVWEEANARGYLSREHPAHGGTLVAVSAAGRAHLQAKRSRSTLAR